MGTVTNVTCCGIDVGQLISDLKHYNDPKETVKKAEAVFRCLMDGKNLTTCYFQMDDDFKQLQQCNECLQEYCAIKCGGVLSCSSAFYTIAKDIETMLDCPDLYTVVRPTTHNDCLDSVARVYKKINGSWVEQSDLIFDKKRSVLMNVNDFVRKYLDAVFNKTNNIINRSTTKQFCSIKSIEQSADHKTVVVIWTDGSKTIVKRSENDPDDIYMAFTAALAKKIYGSNSAIKREIGKNLNEHKAKEKKAEPTRVVRRTDIGCSD